MREGVRLRAARARQASRLARPEVHLAAGERIEEEVLALARSAASRPAAVCGVGSADQPLLRSRASAARACSSGSSKSPCAAPREHARSTASASSLDSGILPPFQRGTAGRLPRGAPHVGGHLVRCAPTRAARPPKRKQSPGFRRATKPSSTLPMRRRRSGTAPASPRRSRWCRCSCGGAARAAHRARARRRRHRARRGGSRGRPRSDRAALRRRSRAPTASSSRVSSR